MILLPLILRTAWLCVLLFSIQSHAASLSKDNADFLGTQFNTPPTKHYIWLTGELKHAVKNTLNHPYFKIRVPYWQDSSQVSTKTVWILEEIGKHKPITVGIVIENQRITMLRIIKFRESRGWEVKLASFTDQFKNSQLAPFNAADPSLNLTQSIDGISGATLSVRAVKKLAKMALLLQKHSKDAYENE